VDRSLSDEMRSITGDQGCRAIFGHHADQILEVAVDDPGILIDLDTPDQLARAEGAVRAGQPLDCLLAEAECADRHPRSTGSDRGRGARHGASSEE
jgi:molybdenum cofactor cytidylyltransferase